ncbi:hypothetical protein C8R44DRAFT_740217 [Mycena epipterygia]|nr:hypothetical protein C8R44DRAFT_740217 [Mycena epipterygia]
MTAASTVLDIQELCDYIADFFHESSTDLKTCAFVSPRLTSAAQRHLFHDIILHPDCPAIDFASHLPPFDESTKFSRLCFALDESPHLVALIRRLRVSLQEDVVKQLRNVKFPNLQEIVFHTAGGRVSEPSFVYGAEIIGLPSIHRLGLVFLVFHDADDLRRLLGHVTTRLESLFLHIAVELYSRVPTIAAPSPYPKIQQLRLVGRTCPRWLTSDYCPFDFSELLDVGVVEGQSFIPILDRSRFTITRLHLKACRGVEKLNLRRFPSLTHLTIFATENDFTRVGVLLEPLPSSSRLAVITLRITMTGQHYAASLQSLGSTLAAMPLPALCRVNVLVSFFGADSADMESQVQAAFVEFNGRSAYMSLSLTTPHLHSPAFSKTAIRDITDTLSVAANVSRRGARVNDFVVSSALRSMRSTALPPNGLRVLEDYTHATSPITPPLVDQSNCLLPRYLTTPEA